MQPHNQTSLEKSTLLRLHGGHAPIPFPGGIEHFGGKTNRIGGRAGDILREASPNARFRGIYLRPTLFMIDGTATHLMEVLYPSTRADSFLSATATNSLLPATTEKPTWWGYRRPHSLASWVCFEYSLTPVSPLSAAFSIVTETPEGYTEEELVRELPHGLHPAVSEQWLEVAQQMSRNLRENRHSAPFRAEDCGTMGNPLPPSRVSLPLGGDEECLLPNGSALLGDVEVAVRAMRPGEEFAFLIMNPKTFYEGMHGTHVSHLFNNPGGSPFRCVYLRIKLLYLLPRVSMWLSVIQRYIVDAPASLPKEPEGTQMTPEHVYNYVLPIHICRYSSFCIDPSEMTLIDTATYPCALRAFFVANASVLLGCHLTPPPQTGFVGVGTVTQQSSSSVGITAKGTKCVRDSDDAKADAEEGGEKAPTEEEALAFLRCVFFASPRDGATVACTVVQKSLLTGCVLTPKTVTGVELGSMSLPLWLEALLQTMQSGEKDFVSVQQDCEDDGALLCSLADELRTAVSLQARVMEEMRGGSISLRELAEERGTPLGTSLSSLNSFSSIQALHNSGPRDESGPKQVPSHEVHYLVSLDSFANVYDTTAFFFVHPENSLRVVQKLGKEAKALRRMSGTRQANVERQLETDDRADYDKTNSGHQYSGSNTVEDFALPACATAQQMTIHRKPFGHINRPSEERGIVKAIQKMNLVVLFLTFHVNERSMLARGVPAVLMQERVVTLMNVFCRLGRLYAKLHHRDAYTLAVAALSAAIVLSPQYPQLWMRRGTLYRRMHDVHNAMCDLTRAKFLAEENMRRSASSRGTEAAEGDREIFLTRFATATAPTAAVDAAGGGGAAAAECPSADEVAMLRRIIRRAETLLTELRTLQEEEGEQATPSPSRPCEEKRAEE
ncbi:hypothetical protein TRSC58_06392 [Trypanosoma rangeli SC58]|uniref:Uncharacterized protein n=1 Tax=Trypanosoma rangeli SC58 TaxID=429131 RepID=A0A061ISQ0_TRYRA|nr:hypothetical protein TRSC58_06392 [Trypanosoma rangeli SC58]